MYSVWFRFANHEETKETFDSYEEMMDAIDMVIHYGYDLGYEDRIPLKSLEIIF